MPNDCRLPGVNIVLISYKTNIITRQRVFIFYKWASSRQNLSSVFPSKRDTNTSPQLQQRLARSIGFRVKQV